MDSPKLSPEQQFFVLEKSNPVAWALLPHAIERVKRFCTTYGTDLDPEALGNLLQIHFVGDKPLLLMVVGYSREHGVFGHALGSIDEVTGRRFLTILQFETDIPLTDKGEISRVFDQFKLWGAANGAREIQLVTRNEKLVRLFRMKYGFKLHRYLMRAELVLEQGDSNGRR